VRNKSGQAKRYEKRDRQLKHGKSPLYQPLAKGPIRALRFKAVSSRGQNGFARLQEGGAALSGPAFSVPSRVPKWAILRWTRLDRCRRNGAGQGQKRLIKQTDQRARRPRAPVKVGPRVGTELAASCTDEARL
jgi:hypothetical protein